MEPRASRARVEVPTDPRDLPGDFPFQRPIEVSLPVGTVVNRILTDNGLPTPMAAHTFRRSID